MTSPDDLQKSRAVAGNVHVDTRSGRFVTVPAHSDKRDAAQVKPDRVRSLVLMSVKQMEGRRARAAEEDRRPIAELPAALVERYGTTDQFRDAVFMLPDGTMVKGQVSDPHTTRAPLDFTEHSVVLQQLGYHVPRSGGMDRGYEYTEIRLAELLGPNKLARIRCLDAVGAIAFYAVPTQEQQLAIMGAGARSGLHVITMEYRPDGQREAETEADSVREGGVTGLDIARAIGELFPPLRKALIVFGRLQKSLADLWLRRRLSPDGTS